METIDKANHFAKVAFMVKDHMKTAMDPTAIGGLAGAGIGGIGNVLIRKFLERNKKVKPTSTVNNFLLGALGGGALGAGGTYLYNHGMKPDLNKTITAQSGNVATLGQIDSAANNANAVEGSQFNRLRNLVLGGGENQAGEISTGSEVNDLAHTTKNTALGAGILSMPGSGRHSLIKAINRYRAAGDEKALASVTGGKDAFTPEAMMQSGKFSLKQGPVEDALSRAHLNRLKLLYPEMTSPDTGETVAGMKGVPKAPAIQDHMRLGGENYAKLPMGSASQRANLAAYIKDPAGTPTSDLPRHYDVDRASAKSNLMTGLTKSLALGQVARMGNNIWEMGRLLSNRFSD